MVLVVMVMLRALRIFRGNSWCLWNVCSGSQVLIKLKSRMLWCEVLIISNGSQKCTQPRSILPGESPGRVQCGCWPCCRVWRCWWANAASHPSGWGLLMAAITLVCQAGAGWGLALPPATLTSRAEPVPKGRRCCAASQGAACSSLPYVLRNPLQPERLRALHCCTAMQSLR